MDVKELKAALGKPQMARLKAVGKGIKVGQVMGSRVLVKTVQPFTEMDRVEGEGLIHIPEAVKKDNTPMPTTGVIVQLGPLANQGPKPTEADILHEGDMVMFPKFSGTDFTIEEADFRILEAAEIICTLVDTEEVVKEA